MRGKLITLEGPDGSGKSTNFSILVEALVQNGYQVVQTREPGGTKIAEKIRELLLTHHDEPMIPLAELLLFSASRAQHLETVIKPALAAGKVVICDRFADTSFAYQGVGRGYMIQYLQLEKMVHDGFEPNYTLYFDVTLEESTRRLNARREESNRLDEEELSFKQRCFEGYRQRFNENPHRMYRIDSMLTREEVATQVRSWVDNVFIPNNPLGMLQEDSIPLTNSSVNKSETVDAWNQTNLQIAAIMALNGSPQQKENARRFFTTHLFSLR